MNKRLDHQPMYRTIIGGLVPLSMTMIYMGPEPYSELMGLSARFQALLVLSILVGGMICGFGMLLGTRHFIPKVDVRLPYALNIAGSFPVLIGLGVYIGVIAINSSPPWAALLVSFGTYVVLGTINSMWNFFCEIRRFKDDDEGQDDANAP